MVAQVQSTWNAVAPVVAQLEERDDLGVEVVTLESNHEVRSLSTDRFIEELGHVPRDIDWLERHLAETESGLALVLFYDPWDGLRPQAAHSTTIAACGVRMAYIPYGTNVGGGEGPQRYAYDLPLHQLAYRIYARSDEQRRLFREYCSAGDEHVRVLGVPKFDLARRLGTDSPSALPTVLWNPHFSVEPGGWSTFHQYLDSFIHYARSHPQVHFIVRPHFRLLRDASHSSGELFATVTKMRNAATQLANFEIDTDAEYLSSFRRAHAMVSDLSSLIPEFLVTGKPLLYLHRTGSPGPNSDAQYFFECPTALAWPGVQKFVDDVATGIDTDAPRRQLLLERHFPLLDERSAPRIATDLAQLAAEALR